MFTIILMSGNPCSGRSTAATAIYDYLKSHGLTTDTVSICHRKPGSAASQADHLEFTIYKTITKMKDFPGQKVIIIDGAEFSAYDRDATLEMLIRTFKDLNVSDNEVQYCAVHLARSNRFSFDHNEDAGHEAYTKKVLYNMLNIMQQPIYKEGFDAIYRQFSNNEINPEEVIASFNMATGNIIVEIPKGKLVASAEPVAEPVLEPVLIDDGNIANLASTETKVESISTMPTAGNTDQLMASAT